MSPGWQRKSQATSHEAGLADSCFCSCCRSVWRLPARRQTSLGLQRGHELVTHCRDSSNDPVLVLVT